MRYPEISVEQLFDLTLAIKELTELIHARHTAQRVSTTTIVQDFERVHGQANGGAPIPMGDEGLIMIPQLHVHLIPRQSNHNMSNEELDVMVKTFSTT